MIKRVTSDVDNIMRFRGLSSDEKPEAENGAEFFEMDTGITYYYDGETKTWGRSGS